MATSPLSPAERIIVGLGICTVLAVVGVCIFNPHTISDTQHYLVASLVDGFIGFILAGGIIAMVFKGVIAAIIAFVVLAVAGQLVVKFSPALVCALGGLLLYIGTTGIGETLAAILGCLACMVLLANVVVFYKHT